MFTGIVAAVGRIETVSPLGDNADAGVRLSIDAGGLPLADVALGDSIAIQGACMTVVAKADNRFEVDVSRESLSKTVGLEGPGEVNLEKALRLADHIGGTSCQATWTAWARSHTSRPSTNPTNCVCGRRQS